MDYCILKLQDMEQSSVVPTQPSSHRKLMLRIAKLLSREDVDELLYLSEDSFESQSPSAGSVSSGVDLMRSLERHGKLGPGNYSYLLSCLREIGRIDLETSLSKAVGLFSQDNLFIPMPPTLPSFSSHNQLFGMKMSGIRSKQTAFASSMRHVVGLVSDMEPWRLEIKKKYQIILSCLSASEMLQDSSKVLQVVETTLESVSSTGHAWCMAVSDFEQRKSFPMISRYLRGAEMHMQNFHNALDSINWKKQWRMHFDCMAPRHTHLIGRVSTQAASNLCALASELLGESKLEGASKELSNILTTIESIFYLSSHAYSVITWFVTLINEVASGRIDIRSCQQHLEYLLEQHKPQIAAHWSTFHNLLYGTNVLNTITECGLVDPSKATTYPSTIVSVAELLHLIVVPLTVLLLVHSEVLTVEDWLLIQTRLIDHFKAMTQDASKLYCRLVLVVVNAVRSELDSFAQRTVALLGSEVAPGLKDLAMGVFQY